MTYSYGHDYFQVDAKAGTVAHAGFVIFHDNDPIVAPAMDGGTLVVDATAAAKVRANCN